jgi:Ser/Thr protein kinase RdoA (MazF antagonist)
VNPLSTQQLTPIYEQLAAQALAQYALPDTPRQLQLLTFVNNATFKVTLPQTGAAPFAFALRLHRPGETTVERIEAETKWLRAIRRDTSLKVPGPQLTAAGTSAGTLTDNRLPAPVHFVLFDWLDGHFLPTVDQTPDHAQQVGRFIGSLHQHSATSAPGVGLQRPRLDVEGLFDWEALERLRQADTGLTTDHLALFAIVAERAQAVFHTLDHTPETFGLIHGDLIWKNYFFHEAGVGALDFDDCGWGYYLYDLAPTLLGYRDEAHYPALKAGLLAGYGEMRLLPSLYERYLDLLIAARHVRSCCWLADRLTNPHIRQHVGNIVRHRVEAIRQLL